MKIRIRDWDTHFEADRTRQWKTLKWVPIPNKQGSGYRKIMSEKQGLEIFGCWIALVEIGSLCSPRGDLSKYDLSDLARLTLIDKKHLEKSIIYLSQSLDWIELIENLDISAPVKAFVSSIQSSSIQSRLINSNNNTILNTLDKREIKKHKFDPPNIDEVILFFKENGYSEEKAKEFFKYYSEGNPPWYDQRGNPVRSWKQKARVVWFKTDNEIRVPNWKKEQEEASEREADAMYEKNKQRQAEEGL